ncbi:hypothetical protein G5I_05028 [Acromyrmex echinatior]|uniref:Chitin-binding type-2 domain-containing protein n=2 Tax=Acromyrmex echinatior TaxID=103372 RepID=F4WH71_ACREC|nr:hypothetical protein G5I_05028 [Acromyrmex echinatior]
MKILLIFLAYVTLVYCAKAKKQILDQEVVDGYEFRYTPDASDLGLIESNSHYVEAAPVLAVAASGHRSSHLVQPGYSVGGPLASIARGAADQAKTQLNQQPSAAGQAAYEAKNTLAQAAAQSAATAAAALAGKQIIVMGLEQQSRDAYVAVDGEKQQLQQAQRAAAAAKNAAQQAMHQVQHGLTVETGPVSFIFKLSAVMSGNRSNISILLFATMAALHSVIVQGRIIVDDYYDAYQNFQPVVGFRQPIVVKEEPKKDQDFSKIPGIPGIDYPLYHTVPPTSFSCAHVPVVPGMYANVETGCQAYHICHDGREGHQGASFLCTNGTLFNQNEFACDWWYNVNCADAPSLYRVNEDPLKNPYVPQETKDAIRKRLKIVVL